MMAGPYRLIRSCTIVSFGWKPLDKHRACFAAAREMAQNCAARPTQTLYTGARAVQCVFAENRSIVRTHAGSPVVS